MTASDKKLLRDFIALYQRVHRHWRKFENAVGIDPNGEYCTLLWSIMDKLIAMTSIVLEDHFDWLAWYVHDNECGKRAFEAYAGNGHARKPIKNTRDLIALIDASRKQP